MTEHQNREQIEAEIAELKAKNEAATSWGAAVGARSEEIEGLRRQLDADLPTAADVRGILRGSSAESCDLPFLRTLQHTLRVMKRAHSNGGDRLMSIWTEDVQAVEEAIETLLSCGAESNRHSGAVGNGERAEQSNPGGGHEVTEQDAQKIHEQKAAGMNPRPAADLMSDVAQGLTEEQILAESNDRWNNLGSPSAAAWRSGARWARDLIASQPSPAAEPPRDLGLCHVKCACACREALEKEVERLTRARSAPTATVETDDITEALNARQASINESMARPQCSAGNAGVTKAAIAPNSQSLKAAKEPALADGCCSAIQPCSHQRSAPSSICDTCRAALPQSVRETDAYRDTVKKIAAAREKRLAELIEENAQLRADLAKKRPETLPGMIAEVYGELDAEDCAMIDREWARMRGYILPTNGTSTLTRPHLSCGEDK